MPNRAEIFLNTADPKSHLVSHPSTDKPMRIIVMGGYSGHRHPNGYSIRKIDVDNFDQNLASIKPNLQLSLDDSLPVISIEFEDLEDFHPDNLFKKIGIFAQFSRIRQKLVNPATVKEGALELHGLLNLSRMEQQAPSESVFIDTEDDQQTLDRLLGESPSPDARVRSASGEQIALRYIREVIAEHIVEDVSQFQEIYINAVDDTIGALMRQLLHHPEFQALEAAWRSLHLLVTGLKTDETLSLHLLDISKDRLSRDLLAEDQDLANTVLYRQLITQTVNSFGGEPWSLLIGNYAFTHSDDDIALLTAMGCIASHAGGPFLAAADPQLLGCQSWPEQSDYHEWRVLDKPAEEKWLKLRQSAIAPWIGLTFPRILLRLPYGAGTDPVDTFQFEEMSSKYEHESFFWGNAAFHCGLLIGQTFSEQGRDMRLGDYLEVFDLPAYVESTGDESRLMPCAEVCINDHTAEKILESGVMPFSSHRNLNRVRLVRFQSIADPPQNLRAPWNRA